MFDKLFGSKKSDNKNGNRKILIVDDNEIDRKIIRSALEKDGYQTVQAENGAIGLEMARKEKPDLVFLDCQMPVMDGLTMCKKLKEDDDLKHTPVIFLTALDTPRNIIDCFEVDAENYLSKPISPKILTQQVKIILDEHKS
jgi:CheY-like chemotaxis protein